MNERRAIWVQGTVQGVGFRPFVYGLAIPKSGYKLRYEYRHHDAERLFEVQDIETQESGECISGQVLRGPKKPHDCPAFGKSCTPQSPLGATMVSSEGACAAYYAYGRHLATSRKREPQLVQIGTSN